MITCQQQQQANLKSLINHPEGLKLAIIRLPDKSNQDHRHLNHMKERTNNLNRSMEKNKRSLQVSMRNRSKHRLLPMEFVEIQTPNSKTKCSLLETTSSLSTYKDRYKRSLLQLMKKLAITTMIALKSSSHILFGIQKISNNLTILRLHCGLDLKYDYKKCWKGEEGLLNTCLRKKEDLMNLKKTLLQTSRRRTRLFANLVLLTLKIYSELQLRMLLKKLFLLLFHVKINLECLLILTK
jgi:hypothetical protein